MKNAIELNNVSKIYSLNKSRRGEKRQCFYALHNITAPLPQGKAIGLLGTNGSGKSTLALMFAGIATPDEGDLKVNGSSALVAINLGLNPHLTGLENIRSKGALMGLKPQKIQNIIDGVAEFSELGDFLYQPVKKYSSGMKSRLGFSINLCLDTDILIVDEALSVGDKAFANKCLQYMTELKDKKKTIIFISHTVSQIESFCDEALWIEAGQLKGHDVADKICADYKDYTNYLNALSSEERNRLADEKFAERIISNTKENKIDRFLFSIQQNK